MWIASYAIECLHRPEEVKNPTIPFTFQSVYDPGGTYRKFLQGVLY